MNTFKYVGSIASYRLTDQVEYNIELFNCNNRNIPPVRLTATGEMFDYINDIQDHDDEEKYLDREFYYDDLFRLLAVVVPGSDYRPAKVILSDHIDNKRQIIPYRKAAFYGTDQRINTKHPESMSEGEYNRLYHELFKMDALNNPLFENPSDFWSTARDQKAELEELRERVCELEDRLHRITSIAKID